MYKRSVVIKKHSFSNLIWHISQEIYSAELFLILEGKVIIFYVILYGTLNNTILILIRS